LGFVPDVKPYLDQAEAGICPVRQGSGTRLKVLTFMACGLPLVSTPKGAEGISCTGGKDILLAEDAEGFAASILEIFCNEEKRRELGQAARRLMCERYDWEIIGKSLRAAYTEIFS
jgi:glycosyltransferase involved in cell wall biosynthesis